MSKINVKQRLSRTNGAKVGPNDARRLIQHKITKPLKKYDARDHLNKTNKVSDARQKLNKIKAKKSSGNLIQSKSSNITKTVKTLMTTPIKSNSKTSLQNGALTRTLKGKAAVQTKLKGGTLTRTLMGRLEKRQRKPPPIRNIPSLSDSISEKDIPESFCRAEIHIDSSSTRNRKREKELKDWNVSPASSRRFLPTKYAGRFYDNYSTVRARPERSIQLRPRLVPMQVPRSYGYEDFTMLAPEHSNIVERSYRPELEYMYSDESRAFRDFLQQEMRRSVRISEEILELQREARRRSLLDFEESKDMYYQQNFVSRKSSSTIFSNGYDVIVSNLIPVIHESEIGSCFDQFGNVLNIDFIDKTTAKVIYETEDDAKAAAMYLDHKEIPVVFGTSYLNTKYSKQRISVRLAQKQLIQDNNPFYFMGDKRTSRIFKPMKSEREIAPLMQSRANNARAPPPKQFTSRHVEPHVGATHGALFNNRTVQLGPTHKSFITRRM